MNQTRFDHTHAARATEPSAHAGVGAHRSRHSFVLRKTYARENGLGGGWLCNSRDGRYDDDEQLLDWLARGKQDSKDGDRTQEPQERLSWSAAKAYIDQCRSVNPEIDLEGLISQLPADDQVKNLASLHYNLASARDNAA